MSRRSNNGEDEKLLLIHLASLLNHSPTPNVNYSRQTSSSIIKFVTFRRVEAGEELCICYSADESKLWFTPSGQASTSTSKSPSSPDGAPHPNGSSARNLAIKGERRERSLPEFEGLELFAPDDAIERLERAKRREVRKAEIRAEERGSKETRRQRYFAKHKTHKGSSANGSSDNTHVIAHPRPLRPGDSFLESSGTSRDSGTDTPTSFDYPEYPDVPEGLVSDLPEPLHSRSGRRKNGEEAVLVDNLDWVEEEWLGKEGSAKEVIGWGDAMRIKGPTEMFEDEEEQSTRESACTLRRLWYNSQI